MNTDLQLLSRYHHTGEADAFRQLVEAHAGMVFATARRVTRDASLAEDIAQETFIELARRGRDVRDAVGAWLHRVAWRKAANLVRHDVMRQRYEPMAAEQWGTEGESTWEELEPAIDEALNELPADQRETLIAHYLEGLTQQALAERLGISQSTVSRTLDAGVQELRSKLRAKGLLCGTGLAAMLSAHAMEAAPASLMTSLGKLALSGVGAGATATGLALLLKTKAAVIIGAVALVVAAAGYDLASSHSRLEGWWNTAFSAKDEISKPNQKPLVAEPRTSSPAASSAAAKAIWDAVPKFASADALDALKRRVMFEQNPEKKLALLHQMGVRLSRAKLDRWLAEAQLPMYAYRIDAEPLLQDYARTFNGLVAAWAEEDPLAALAWTVRQMPMTEVAENGYKWRTWDRTSRDVWDVLLAASKAATFDAASWSALIAGIEDPVTRARAGMVLQAVTDPQALLDRLDPKSDEDHVVADDGFICQLVLNRHGKQGWPMVIAKLTSLNDQVGLSHVIGRALSDNDDPTLLPLMIQCLPPSSDFGNLLRACSGDSTASFEAAWKFNEAQREFTKAFSSKALKVDVEDNGSDFASELYMGWSKADPRAAILHALETDHKSDIGTIISFMDKAHQTEGFLLEALGTMKPKQRDRYLCNLYEAQSTIMTNGVADIDYRAFLQRVMQSETLQDQVVGAVNALSAWFVVKPNDAAAHAQEWLRELPLGEERTELAMHIGESMGRIDPAAAIQFARAESLTGDEAEFVCRTAMRQFAIGHSAEDCQPLLQQITDDRAYAVAMNTIAAVKHGDDAAQAITFLKANARGDWQHDAMELLCDHDFNLRNPSTSYSASAEAMLALSLAKLGPEVSDRMKRLAGYWARYQPVSVPLQWTTRLPADIAIATRQQLAKSLQNGATERNGATDDLLSDAVPVFRTWVQTAPLSEVERNDLLAVLKRIEDKEAKP